MLRVVVSLIATMTLLSAVSNAESLLPDEVKLDYAQLILDETLQMRGLTLVPSSLELHASNRPDSAILSLVYNFAIAFLALQQKLLEIQYVTFKVNNKGEILSGYVYMGTIDLTLAHQIETYPSPTRTFKNQITGRQYIVSIHGSSPLMNQAKEDFDFNLK